MNPLARLQIRAVQSTVRANRVQHLRVERVRNVQHSLLVDIGQYAVVVVWCVRLPQCWTSQVRQSLSCHRTHRYSGHRTRGEGFP